MKDDTPPPYLPYQIVIRSNVPYSRSREMTGRMGNSFARACAVAMDRAILGESPCAYCDSTRLSPSGRSCANCGAPRLGTQAELSPWSEGAGP